MSLGPTIIDLVESIKPFTSVGGEPAMLFVLASERCVISLHLPQLPLRPPLTTFVHVLTSSANLRPPSHRRAFFEPIYGTAAFDDALEGYGPTRHGPVWVDGPHFEVANQCISNRVPEFTTAIEAFLADDDTSVVSAPSTEVGVACA